MRLERLIYVVKIKHTALAWDTLPTPFVAHLCMLPAPSHPRPPTPPFLLLTLVSVNGCLITFHDNLEGKMGEGLDPGAEHLPRS